MFKFEEKRKIRHALYSKITIFFLCLLIVLLARSTYGVYQKERESRENLALIERQFDELQKRDETLQSEIGRLGTEKGIEEEVRDKFRMAKKGEALAVIIDDSLPKENEESVPEKTIWQKAWSWIAE